MWIRALAVAAAALVLAPFVLSASSLWGGALVVVAAIASFVAFVTGVLPRLRASRPDPYDLGELRRVHEEEEIHALHGRGPLGDGGTVVCPRCFREYPSRVGACPRCGSGG